MTCCSVGSVVVVVYSDPGAWTIVPLFVFTVNDPGFLRPERTVTRINAAILALIRGPALATRDLVLSNHGSFESADVGPRNSNLISPSNATQETGCVELSMQRMFHVAFCIVKRLLSALNNPMECTGGFSSTAKLPLCHTRQGVRSSLPHANSFPRTAPSVILTLLFSSKL